MKAIFAGTFDPFTLGHADIVKRALSVFGNVTVAVADDTGKNTLGIAERLKIAELSLDGIDGVTVEGFKGLLSDYIAKCGDSVIVRGIRNCRDLEYERDLVRTYKALCGADSVFFVTSAEYEHVSSTTVRELVKLGGSIEGFVSDNAEAYIVSMYSARK